MTHHQRIIQIIHPSIVRITLSIRNCLRIFSRVAQIDLTIQISLRLSATQANITFMIQIQDTTNTMVHTQMSRYLVIDATHLASTSIVHWSLTAKSSSIHGFIEWFFLSIVLSSSMAFGTTLMSFAKKIIFLGSDAFERNLFEVAIGIMSESSKEKGHTHPEESIVPMILKVFQLTRMDFPTGFAPSQKMSSTTIFHMITTRSHLIASLSEKNLHSFIDRGRALEKFSFPARTLYCFFLSL